MRRRELLAGLGSVGALVAGGVIATSGLPSMGDGPSNGADSEVDGSTGAATDLEGTSPEPITIETIEAPGSEAGEVRLPAEGEPTFIDFFGTWCDPCKAQMPALVEAHDRISDEVLFISVTWEPIDSSEIAEWWVEYDGDWLVARDPVAEVTARYNLPGLPYAVALDETGTVRWSQPGRKTADELVAGIENAL